MTRSRKAISILTLAARLFLGGVFLYAGVPKIFSPDEFAQVIFNYQLLPDMLINPVAIVLPWIETIVGLLLITGIWLPGSVLLVNLLLAAFMGALLFNYARGLDTDCGCFSAGSEGGIGPLTLLRDAGFLAVAVFLLIFTARKNAARPPAFDKVRE